MFRNQRKMPEMSTSEQIRTGEDLTIPQEIAGVVNLLAHPLAGMSAATAVGFAMASHGFGLWLGAMTGAAEASMKLFKEAEAPAATAKAKPSGLKLVASQPELSREAAPNEADKPRVAIAKPDVVDDLKVISGIGPKLEKVLNGLGIWTYAQISGLSDTDVALLDEKLGFSGRIGRDGWVEQARALQLS